MDPTCIICKECFEKGNHKGHRFIVQTSSAGCCDCGDEDAWKVEGFCSDHLGQKATASLNLDILPNNVREGFT